MNCALFLCLPHTRPLCALTTRLFCSPLIPTSPPVPRLLHKPIVTFYVFSFKNGICIGIKLFHKYLEVFILNSICKSFCDSLPFLLKHEVSILELNSLSSTWWQMLSSFFQGRKKNRTTWSTWTWIMCLGIKFGSQRLFPSKLSSDLWYYRRKDLKHLDFLQVISFSPYMHIKYFLFNFLISYLPKYVNSLVFPNQFWSYLIILHCSSEMLLDNNL